MSSKKMPNMEGEMDAPGLVASTVITAGFVGSAAMRAVEMDRSSRETAVSRVIIWQRSYRKVGWPGNVYPGIGFGIIPPWEVCSISFVAKFAEEV
jgi:hypothetical protein